MSRIYISLSLIFIFVIGIGVALDLIKTPKIFRPRADVVGVTLSMNPDTLNVSEGDEFILDVNLDSATETVTGVEMFVAFDPKMLRVDDINTTQLFPMELGKDLATPGLAKLIVLSDPGQMEKKNGVVAKIKIKALNGGSSEIGFSKETRVSAVGKLNDVLEAVTGTIVNVGGGSKSDLQRRLDYMKDENRVQRALDEYYEKKDQEGFMGMKSNNPIVILINKVKEFVGGLNESVEDKAKEVIKTDQ